MRQSQTPRIIKSLKVIQFFRALWRTLCSSLDFTTLSFSQHSFMALVNEERQIVDVFSRLAEFITLTILAYVAMTGIVFSLFSESNLIWVGYFIVEAFVVLGNFYPNELLPQ